MLKIVFTLAGLITFRLILAQPAAESAGGWHKDTISVHTPKEAEVLSKGIRIYLWGNSGTTTATPVQLDRNADLQTS